MAKNEEGEFELILGNRQLISVFLIVVILLGVFFSMGYIVGRNSAPAPVETARDARTSMLRWAQPDSKSPDSPVQDFPLAPLEPEKEKPAKAAAPAKGQSAAPQFPAAKATPQAPAAKTASQAPAAKAPPPATVAKAAPSAPAAKEEKPKAPPPPASVNGDPAAGEYWQVVATDRADSEIITEALSKKGFRAVIAPAPKPGIFRVLVGPLKDSSSQAQTRTGLEAAGFKNPMLRKY